MPSDGIGCGAGLPGAVGGMQGAKTLGGWGLAVPLFGAREAAVPRPYPAGLRPSLGLTAEPAFLRSRSRSSEGASDTLPDPEEKTEPQGLREGRSHANGDNSGPLPALVLLAGCREEDWNHSALSTAVAGFLPWPYVNHEIFLLVLAKGLLMW